MLSFEPGVRLLDPDSVCPLTLGVSTAGTCDRPDEIDRFDVGFEAGVAAGREQERAEMGAVVELERVRLSDAATVLRQAADDLRARRQGLLDTETAALAALAVELTETLVGSLPDRLDPQVVTGALSLAAGDDLVTLRLHPDDVDVVSGLELDAKVVVDPSVEKGGCVVEVGPMTIDTQRGPALERLRDALTSRLGGSDQ